MTGDPFLRRGATCVGGDDPLPVAEATMCEHRSRAPMARTWDAWLAVTAVSFAVFEGVGIATGGEDATLTAHIRRAAGLSPRCRHARIGRAALVSVFGWLIIHLAFGVLPREGWLDY